jgi:hypothetical protein
MTFRTKFPLHLYQKYFLAKDSFDSFLGKLEVLSDSNVIIYSVRILIVVLALLMGYIHSPKEKDEVSNVKNIELIDKNLEPVIEQVN